MTDPLTNPSFPSPADNARAPADLSGRRAALPTLVEVLGDARLESDGASLRVRAGLLETVWRWTQHGLVIQRVEHRPTGQTWQAKATGPTCDWQLPDGSEPPADAELLCLDVSTVTDDRWTSPHLRLVATIRYPSAALAVRWSLWAYPGGGLRVGLAARRQDAGAASWSSKDAAESARTAWVPAPESGWGPRRPAGYYVGTQNRNRPDTPLRRCETVSAGLGCGETDRFDWANLLTLTDGGAALTWVKESHRGVNQPGYDGGAFLVDPAGAALTGWGLRPEDVTDTWREGWAWWMVMHEADESSRQTALKRFDQLRYPVDPAHDLPVMANLWGSSDSKATARDLADEAAVIEAIDRAADLGIEVVQIDDGWQTPPGAADFETGDWRPHPRRYPDGWRTVRDHAAKRGVGLGLWAAWRISAERLIENQQAGGFRHFKIDFMNLDTYDKIHGLMRNAEALATSAHPRPRINWDMTERGPRVGTYFGREFGSVYLANRKPKWPPHCVYVPWLMLRDAWHLAHDANLFKFQISTTNLDRCDPARSNAARHRHDYALAITLMGSPLWFCHPRELSDDAAAQFRPLLETYKRHREKLARCIVYPIGDEPSDASWTGFQAHDEESASGYLMIFREIDCPEPHGKIGLHFLAGRELELENLLTGQTETVSLDDRHGLPVTIDSPADYRFLAYRVRDRKHEMDPAKRAQA